MSSRLAKELANLALEEKHHHKRNLVGAHHHKSHHHHHRGGSFEYDIPRLGGAELYGGSFEYDIPRLGGANLYGGAELYGGKRKRKTNRPLTEYQMFVKEYAMSHRGLKGKDLIREAAMEWRSRR